MNATPDVPSKRTPQGSRRGSKPPAWAVEHVRCDKCRPEVAQCNECYNQQRRNLYEARRKADPQWVARELKRKVQDNRRNGAGRRAREKARREADPTIAERERMRKREYARRQRAADAAKRPEGYVAKGGQKPTRPRCEACPDSGAPCRDCLNAHRRLTRAPRAKPPAFDKPAANKPTAKRAVLTPEQRAERARLAVEKKAAKAAAARELAAARKAQVEREPATIAAEVAREVAKPQPCLGCLTRGHHENGYCRRCQAYASAPPAPRIASASYTGSKKRSA